MEPSAPPRRRTFDLPKPEAGLAEWMTKIKALQSGAKETRGGDCTCPPSKASKDSRCWLRWWQCRFLWVMHSDHEGTWKFYHVSCTHQRHLRLVSRPPSHKSPSTEIFSSPVDRSIGADAPRKLTGTSSSSNIDTSSITHRILPKSSHLPATQPPPSQQPEPIFLATFIGQLDLDSTAMRRNKMFMILHSLSNGSSTPLTLFLGKVVWPCQE